VREYIASAEESHHLADHPPFSPPVEKLVIVAVALLLLIPCFWNPHIQAGDFSSHMYNAWLTLKVEHGEIQGLAIESQWTNTLVDWILPKLLETLGRSGAERIAAGFAVELFFWGAFFFISVARDRLPWLIAPVLAMITYGTVFQLGFLNFYLATGFSLWLMYVLWSPGWIRATIALPLAALALFAHAIPLAGAIAALLYVYLLRWLPENMRAGLLIVAAFALALFSSALASRFQVHWSWDQVFIEDGLLSALGIGQLWPFGSKYALAAGAMLVIWFMLFLERMDHGKVITDPFVHLWLLSVAGVALLPTSIGLRGYGLPLEFIPDRLSLFVAIFLCAMVSGGRHGRNLTRASGIVAIVYFGCLYLDTAQFMRAEQEITTLVERLPPGQRVVAAVQDRHTRFNSIPHMASGACIERCFDYGNYEAPSGMFPLRVIGPNPALPPSINEVTEIEDRSHTVTPAEAPIYSVCPSQGVGVWFELKRVEAGQSTCNFDLPITSQIF